MIREPESHTESEGWGRGEKENKRVIFENGSDNDSKRQKILLRFLAAAPNLLLVHRIVLPHYIFKVYSLRPRIHSSGCDLRNVIIKPTRETKTCSQCRL